MASDYTYNDHRAKPDPPHQPAFLELMTGRLREFAPEARTLLDAGCGDGNFTASLVEECALTAYGIDASQVGIEVAGRRGVGQFAVGSLYQSLTEPFPDVDVFDVIVSVEVIEHLYDPRGFVRRADEALRPGGLLILTTPYWGYLKNVVLALTNRIDRSLTALWDGGHIKHWSRKTLTQLVSEQGFDVLAFDGSKGVRPPLLWNGFMMTYRKPAKATPVG